MWRMFKSWMMEEERLVEDTYLEATEEYYIAFHNEAVLMKALL